MDAIRKKQIFSYLNLSIIAIIIFGIGYYLGNIHAFLATSTSFYGSGKEELFNEVWTTLHTQYFYKSLDNNKLVYSALEGMVNSLGDHATLFLSPTETAEFNKTTSGNTFAGIGIELGYKDNNVIVQRILTNSPASPTKLKVGDQLLAINGKSISNEDIDAIVNDIRGTAGSSVKLSVQHILDNSKEDISIVRELIHVDSMYVQKETDSNNKVVDVFTVSRFTEDSLTNWENKWDASIKTIQNDNPSMVVLDLRDDPGGYFDAAVYGLSDFLPEHTVAAMQQTRDNQKQLFYTQANQRLTKYKVEILVNGNTASAAEIFSGAMQYYKKASIVGTTTYGKGTAQDVYTLSDGSTLHVTTVHWLLPSSRWIQPSNPIKPNYNIQYSNDDFKNGNDPQLIKAESL